MAKILLVGAGLTGSLTASLLRDQLPKAELVIWDKANGAGMRICLMFYFYIIN